MMAIPNEVTLVLTKEMEAKSEKRNSKNCLLVQGILAHPTLEAWSVVVDRDTAKFNTPAKGSPDVVRVTVPLEDSPALGAKLTKWDEPRATWPGGLPSRERLNLRGAKVTPVEVRAKRGTHKKYERRIKDGDTITRLSPRRHHGRRQYEIVRYHLPAFLAELEAAARAVCEGLGGRWFPKTGRKKK